MTSPVEFQAANRQLAELAQGEVAGFFSATPSPTQEQVADFFFALVRTYGQAAASVAAEYYNSRRAAAKVRTGFRALIADTAPRGQTDALVRWAMSAPDEEVARDAARRRDDAHSGRTPFEMTPDVVDLDELREVGAAKTRSRLTQTAQRLTLQPGRDTIADSVDADPARPRWARVPHGKSCAFCMLVAGRGAVYRSEATALRSFHDGCNCTPEPVWKGGELSYDPGDYRRLYSAARRDAKSGDLKKILAQMRVNTGAH